MYLKKIEGTFTAAGGSLFTKFIYKIFTYLDLMLGMGEREKKKGMLGKIGLWKFNGSRVQKFFKLYCMNFNQREKEDICIRSIHG